MDNRHLKLNELELLRKKAVKAVVIHTEKQKQAVELFGFCVSLISGYVCDFKSKDELNLVYKKCKMKSDNHSKFSLEEISLLKQTSEHNLLDLMNRLGFGAQKLIAQAYKQDPAKIQAWLTHEYPAIKTRALQENASIYWSDFQLIESFEDLKTNIRYYLTKIQFSEFKVRNFFKKKEILYAACYSINFYRRGNKASTAINAYYVPNSNNSTDKNNNNTHFESKEENGRYVVSQSFAYRNGIQQVDLKRYPYIEKGTIQANAIKINSDARDADRIARLAKAVIIKRFNKKQLLNTAVGLVKHVQGSNYELWIAINAYVNSNKVRVSTNRYDRKNFKIHGLNDKEIQCLEVDFRKLFFEQLLENTVDPKVIAKELFANNFMYGKTFSIDQSKKQQIADAIYGDQNTPRSRVTQLNGYIIQLQSEYECSPGSLVQPIFFDFYLSDKECSKFLVMLKDICQSSNSHLVNKKHQYHQTGHMRYYIEVNHSEIHQKLLHYNRFYMIKAMGRIYHDINVLRKNTYQSKFIDNLSSMIQAGDTNALKFVKNERGLQCKIKKHGESAIIDKAQQDENLEVMTIGSTQLCCAVCDHRLKKFRINRRGTHGLFYYGTTEIADDIKEKNILEQYIKKGPGGTSWPASDTEDALWSSSDSNIDHQNSYSLFSSNKHKNDNDNEQKNIKQLSTNRNANHKDDINQESALNKHSLSILFCRSNSTRQ